MNKFLIAAVAAVAALPALAQTTAEESSMKLEEVPAAVMTAANANANGTTFDKAQMDGEVYELSGKMANGMMMEVDVMADGTIEEVEEQIEMSALPAEVSASLEKELAGFAPTMIEKSTRAEGVVIYEFEGSHDGKEIDAEIAADGTGFAMNDDLAG